MAANRKHLENELKEEKTSENVNKDIIALEVELESARTETYRSVPYPAFYLEQLFIKFNNIKIPKSLEDPLLLKRIENIHDELAILKIKESLYKTVALESVSTENKVTYIKSVIADFKTLLLTEPAIAELKRKEQELKLAQSSLGMPMGGFKIKMPSQHKWILETQSRLVKEKLDLNTSIARATLDYEGILYKELMPQKENQLTTFKNILKAVYLKPHAKESLENLKKSLRDFIKQEPVNTLPEVGTSPKDIPPHLTTFTKVQLELKMHHAEQKQKPIPVKTEHREAFILAKALLRQLEQIKKIPRKPRDLAIDVSPALFFAINWNEQLLLMTLVKKLQKNGNTYGIAKLIMKKYLEKPAEGWDDFLESFKDKLGVNSMENKKFVAYLQMPTGSVVGYKDSTSPLASRAQSSQPSLELSAAHVGRH